MCSSFIRICIGKLLTDLNWMKKRHRDHTKKKRKTEDIYRRRWSEKVQYNIHYPWCLLILTFSYPLKCEQWQCLLRTPQREESAFGKVMTITPPLQYLMRPRSGQLIKITSNKLDIAYLYRRFRIAHWCLMCFYSFFTFLIFIFGIWFYDRLPCSVDSCTPRAIVC